MLMMSLPTDQMTAAAEFGGLGLALADASLAGFDIVASTVLTVEAAAEIRASGLDVDAVRFGRATPSDPPVVLVLREIWTEMARGGLIPLVVRRADERETVRCASWPDFLATVVAQAADGQPAPLVVQATSLLTSSLSVQRCSDDSIELRLIEKPAAGRLRIDHRGATSSSGDFADRRKRLSDRVKAKSVHDGLASVFAMFDDWVRFDAEFDDGGHFAIAAVGSERVERRGLVSDR